jgi:hypothetical protein
MTVKEMEPVRPQSSPALDNSQFLFLNLLQRRRE